jgi:hypothetical protein
MWREFGMVNGDQRFHCHDEVARIESGGKSLSFCNSPQRLEEQMLALSPADAKVTKKFIRLLSGRDMSGAMSLKPPEMESGVPLGGSQGAVFRLAEHYEELGGEIHYKSRAKDVIIKNDRALGVLLEDGTEYQADIVVWAADGHTVIFDILGGRYIGDEVRGMYSDWTPVVSPVHVMLGVARDLSKEPHLLFFEVDNPITIAGKEHHWLHFLHHCFDPNTAPPGKSAVEVWYATPYAYWEELARDRTRYEEEKKRIADYTIAELDKRWPGFASQIEWWMYRRLQPMSATPETGKVRHVAGTRLRII